MGLEVKIKNFSKKCIFCTFVHNHVRNLSYLDHRYSITDALFLITLDCRVHAQGGVNGQDLGHLIFEPPHGKPTIWLGESIGADQLHSNCEADQHHCVRYSDSTVPLLFKYKISSFFL